MFYILAFIVTFFPRNLQLKGGKTTKSKARKKKVLPAHVHLSPSLLPVQPSLSHSFSNQMSDLAEEIQQKRLARRSEGGSLLIPEGKSLGGQVRIS